MTYDQWKTRSPYDDWDDDDPREDDCDHADHEVDQITGEAMCHRCGHTWTLTTEELELEIELLADLQRLQEWQRRWQWWFALRDRIRAFFIRRRRDVDDEIPF